MVCEDNLMVCDGLYHVTRADQIFQSLILGFSNAEN